MVHEPVHIVHLFTAHSVNFLPPGLVVEKVFGTDCYICLFIYLYIYFADLYSLGLQSVDNLWYRIPVSC
jgi:hypothetical protein